MAFGAEIKLSVNKTGKASFRKEIQNYVDEATLNTPVLIKNLALDISSQKRQQIANQLQQVLSADNLTIKVNNIDASGAIANLREQLTTILGGLQIGGLKAFLGSDGAAEAYDKASSSAQKLAEATENVRQRIVAANAAMRELGLIQSTLSSVYKSTMNVGDTDKLAQYVEKYRELESAIQNAKTLEGDAQKQAVANISATTSALSQEVKAQIESEKAAAKKAATAVTAEQAEKRKAAEAERAARVENNLARQTIQLRQQINQYIDQNSTAYKQYGGEIDKLLGQLQSESGLSAVELSRISKEFARIKTNAQESGIAGETFFEKLKSGLSKFGGWAIVTKSMMSAQAQVKKMIEVVRELDAAMTELRKVTDLAETEYELFFNNAIKNAKSVGATLSDTIVASADFARLGYDVDDAADLAHAALIYKNVGDGIENVSDASESLISTIKAFGYEANNAMHVVDAFNEVGNNFAISSVGIGEALQRSASALAAANNTMEESIGLAVGMNNVLQNPQQVGTVLKTSSMYLRAAKIELEEAGESTDGMAVSVSKLREDILLLTNAKVDIQIDENTFKSTFQIYKELSEVWHEIADIDQASLIELIGGKRNASGIISLMTNFADAEAAAEAALDSFGSATSENEKYLDSIAGKIALLELAFETLSSSLISSDAVKGVVDIATAIINLITWLQKLNLLLPLIAASLTVIKGKKMLDEITNIAKTVTPLTNQLIEQKQVTDALSVAVSALSVKEKAQLAVQIQQAVAANGLTDVQGKAIVSSLGLAAANNTASLSTMTLGDAFKKLGVAFASNPFGIALTVITALIPAITSAMNYASEKAEKAIQKANEIKTAYSDAIMTGTNNLSSLEGMREQFEALSRGVKSNGENEKLTNDQYKTYLSLVDSIIDISPGLIKSYDASGNAVFEYATALDEAIKIQEKYIETQRRVYLASADDVFGGNAEEYKQTAEAVRDSTAKLFQELRGYSDSWLNLPNQTKSSTIRDVSKDLYGYDVTESFFTGKYDYASNNLELAAKAETALRDLQGNTSEFIHALRNANNETQIYTEQELIAIENMINKSLVQTQQIDNLLKENADIMVEKFRTEDWYADLPIGALDEFKSGLTNVIDPLKSYTENLFIANEYSAEFASAIATADATSIIKLSEGLKDGSVSIEEYNAAVAAYGKSFEGTENVGRFILEFLNSLSNTPAAPSASEVVQTAQSYEKLADTISVAEKSLNLLNSASKEMKEDGSISADTVSSIIDLLSEEEKLTDYVTAQGDVLVFNTEAWYKRSVAQYENKLASLEAENATLESSEATEENTRKIAENNAMIGIYKALITGAAEATKEATVEIGDAYSKASKAIDSFSNVGRNVELTYDAYQSMIDMDSRYAGTIEYVNGILTVNRDKHSAVTDVILQEQKAMAQAGLQAILLSDDYQNLVSRIDDLSDLEQQKLFDYNADIMGFSVLVSEIDNATSAYKRFLNFTDTSSTDQYNTAIKAFELINKTLNDKTSDLFGQINTDGFELASNFVLGENVEVNTAEFDRGFETVKRYLANEGQGVWNFYDDLVKKGIIDAATGAFDTTIIEVSDKLGIPTEIVEALFLQLEKYQEADFDWVKLRTGLEETEQEVGGFGDSVETVQTKTQSLADTITSINNEVATLNGTPVDLKTSSSETSLGKVSSLLSDVITKLGKISSMSQINVNVNTNTTTTATSTSSSNSSGGLWSKLLGFSAASGTHKAVGGKTLVGELGMETVVDPHTNRWYTVGENGAQFVTLPKDAIVFNAQQTESLFGTGRTSTRGEAMVSGNAAASFADTIKDLANTVAGGIIKGLTGGTTTSALAGVATDTNKNTGAKKSSSSGSSKSSSNSSGSSSEKVTDPFEELKKHYDELNDYFEHLIEHQVFLYKQAERGLDYQGMEASLQEQAKIYQDMMKNAQEGVAALQAQGAKDTDSALQEMEEAYWSAYDDLNSVLDHINNLYVNALTEKIDSVQTAYNNLSNAADEFAKYGGISVDTFQSLIANGVQYLSLLKNTDGQYVINTESIKNIIAAQKEQLAIESALSYISQLREALTKKNTNAVQNLVSLTNQISDSSWNQVYAQVSLLKAMGLTDVQYAKVLENINALKEISGSVIIDIADGAQDIADAYDNQEKALDKLLKYTQDLIEYETKQKVKAIEKQIESYKHLIDLKKKSLQTTKDEASYEDSIAEKVKEIAKLQASIDQLSLDDSRAAIAERLSMMEKLAELQKELSEAQSNHAYDAQVEALDQMSEAYEESRQSDIEALENSISSTEKLYQAAIARITDQWSTLYDELIDWNTEAGNVINSEITENWNLASEAILRYGSYVAALQAVTEASVSTSSGSSDTTSNTVVASTLPKYHSGGVVGVDSIDQSKEIVAVLEKGEIVLDDQKRQSLYNIIDFQEELSKRLGVSIGSMSGLLPTKMPQNLPLQNPQHEIVNNTSIVFNPSIHVEISGGVNKSNDDAKTFGNEVASVAMNTLKDAFTRRGITNLGGAKLSPA